MTPVLIALAVVGGLSATATGLTVATNRWDNRQPRVGDSLSARVGQFAAAILQPTAKPAAAPQTADDVKARVDLWVTANWDAIVQKQEDWLTSHDVYWQGLITHTSPPRHARQTDGAIEADRLASHPTDQADSWLNVWPGLNGVKLDFAIWVDVYNGPSGIGWVAALEFEFDNGDGTIDLWRKAWQYGPEAWRVHDWRLDVIGGVL